MNSLNIKNIKEMNPAVKTFAISNLIMTFALTFIFLYLTSIGFSGSKIVLFYAGFNLLSVIFILFTRTYNIKKFLFLGLIFQALMTLNFAYFNKYSIGLYLIFSAFYQLYFWVSINYLFFKKSTKSDNGINSSFYLIIPGVISTITPILATQLISIYGYTIYYLTATFFYVLIAFYVYSIIPNEVHVANSIESIKKFKGLKTITFIEGGFQFFPLIIIPVYSLKFLQSAIDFGILFSYLGLIGLLISYFFAKRSDEKQERKSLLYPLMFLMIILTLSFAFIKSFLWLMIVSGIFTALNFISFPLRLALSMDYKTTDMGFWKTREILLCSGRVPTLIIAAILFNLNLEYLIFVFYAILLLIYTLLIRFRLSKTA